MAPARTRPPGGRLRMRAFESALEHQDFFRTSSEQKRRSYLHDRQRATVSNIK
jgi:hypothetical protein